MTFHADVHHVGIIVPDQQRIDELLILMGLSKQDVVRVSQYEALCVFAGGEKGLVEFILPDPDSRLSRFNGGIGGIHHVALEVRDIRATMASLAAQGVECLEPEPVRAGDLWINFVPPLATRGFIVEYVQRVGEQEMC